MNGIVEICGTPHVRGPPGGNSKRLSDFSLTGTDKQAVSPEMAAKDPLLTDAGREYRALCRKTKINIP